MVGVGSSSSMSWFFSEREWPPLTMHGDLIPPPRLSHLLNNRFGRFVHCSIKKFAHLRHAPRMKDVWCRGLYQSKGIGILQLSSNAFVSPYSSFFGFFNRGETRKDLGNERTSNFGTSGRGRDSISGGQWTDVLLAANVLIFIAQIASRGKLFLWAAKINNLIEKGQVWRLVTSSFLHVDLWHLMINCYSLSNVGPSIERISGPRRFLAVYFTSAIAGTAMSYWFNKMPSVGASGAIFGMVGSLAVFHMRHRGMFGDGEKDLQNIVKVIIVNMAIGLVVQRIDNWGHLGGLLGGAAASWFLGPAWKYVYLSHDGQRYVVDTAPIWSLLGKKRNLGS